MKLQYLCDPYIDMVNGNNYKKAPSLRPTKSKLILPKIKNIRLDIITDAYEYEDFNSYRKKLVKNKMEIIDFLKDNIPKEDNY